MCGGVVVVGCNPLSVGDPQVATRSFLYAMHRMKVVNYVKMKLPDVTLLGLLWIRAVHERLR
jgi:hypothetical protein